MARPYFAVFPEMCPLQFDDAHRVCLRDTMARFLDGPEPPAAVPTASVPAAPAATVGEVKDDDALSMETDEVT